MAKTKRTLPTTFEAGKRGFELLLSPQNEERLGSEASSAEGCLRTMKHSSDGTEYVISAQYREQQIGQGRYRKVGQPGQLVTVETLSSEGAMNGLIEAALKQREEEQQAADQKARTQRITPLACAFCGYTLGYDPIDHCFATSVGLKVITCPSCNKSLSLEAFQTQYEEHIRQLRADLQHAEEARRLILEIKRSI
jgi:hypothetical protein